MESKETARIETFSDGVFAIAITLLILEIKVPEISSFQSKNDLWNGLAKLWPSYFAFLLSFAFVLTAWICHHALFNLLEKMSPQFVYANAFLLLNIVFLPFPTAILARYVISAYTQSAVVFYILCFFVTGISWNLLYYFSLNPKSLARDRRSAEVVVEMLKYARYALALNLVITLVAWWFPRTAITLNAILWIFWIWRSASMLRKSRFH